MHIKGIKHTHKVLLLETKIVHMIWVSHRESNDLTFKYLLALKIHTTGTQNRPFGRFEAYREGQCKCSITD